MGHLDQRLETIIIGFLDYFDNIGFVHYLVNLIDLQHAGLSTYICSYRR